MTGILNGYYERSFADHSPSVLFCIDGDGHEWRWDTDTRLWTLLDGTPVATRLFDGDPWTDKVDPPAGVPKPRLIPNPD